MSNIASGIVGLGQGAAQAKGQGGGTGGAAEGEGFADAVASVSARDGHGRRSAHAGAGHGEQDAAGRIRIARSGLSRIPEALREASRDAGVTDDEKQLAAHTGRKGISADPETVAAEDQPADAVADAPAEPRDDVGNLLDLLARAAPREAGGQAAARDGEKKGGKVVAADAAGRRADAGLVQDDAKAGGAPEAEMPASDSDKLFRLVRSDGKGRDADMRISGDGEKASLKDANPAGPKGETVTVVDARRYIGLAQNGNSGAVTAAIAQDREWAASLSATGGPTRAEGGATGGVVHTLKIQMNPIELGLVTATLRLHGDGLVVSLQVETGEAYRQLTDDQDAIVRALRGQGFAVDQVSVQLSPVDRSASAQQQGDGQFQQSGGQQQAREGGNGRQNGGQQGSGNFGHEGASHEGGTMDGAGGRSAGSGGVYL